MPEGGKLTIKTYAENGTVQVDFMDTGKGIESKDLPRIFDPFYTTKDDGSGLGLSISHQIIHMHQGTIRVVQTSPNGTIFNVSLPKCTPGEGSVLYEQ